MKINKDKETNTRTINGITLIALVITIIVLLILAGVSIAMLTGQNGILNQANKAKQDTENAKNEELGLLGDYENLVQNYIQSEEGFNNEVGVNSPKLTSGMIAVRYDEGTKSWVKADESNKNNNWYEYSEANKKWANVVTVKENGSKSRKEYINAPEGTTIPMEDITTMFVWIPRYSYNIPNKTGKTIEVSFLKGNTDKEASGVETTKIVHPGFKFGDINLRGIWVAKFEASGVNKDGEIVGNRTAESATIKTTEGAYVTVKPSVPSWREISIGESQYQSMNMANNSSAYGWNNANSHLIKNAEWGACAYLCYSLYGNVPMINGCGTEGSEYYYDMMTGGGPLNGTSLNRYNYDSSTFEENQSYSTANGVKASTTGNVYGIYDMNGGAWERVATYLDNRNNNLNVYGNSNKVKYFENKELKNEYKNYWESYKVSEEERNDSIEIEGQTNTIRQDELWSTTLKDEKYQQARLRLTQANFDNMASHKGIGVNEVSNEFSFYGVNSSGSWAWFKTPTQAGYATTWDNDYVLIGHAAFPFATRGGICYNGASAGVFFSGLTSGATGYYHGFRPVLAF